MEKLRHPEKANKEFNPIKKKPAWIRVKINNSSIFAETKILVSAKILELLIFTLIQAGFFLIGLNSLFAFSGCLNFSILF